MATVGDTLPHCRGTGTSEDPYIFNSFDGFVEAIKVNRAYVNGDTTGEYEDKKKRIIDMNEVLPEGYSDSLYISCWLMDGKDWTIRNLFFKDVQYAIRAYPFDSNRNNIFKNLNILNCYYMSLNANNVCSFFEGTDSSHRNVNFKFINCKFSILINQNENEENDFINANYGTGGYTAFYFDTCSFNIKFFNSVDYFTTSNYNIHFSYCNFKIKFCKSCQNLLGGGYANYIDNCKFKVIGTNDENISYINSLTENGASQFEVNSCYFYLDILLKHPDYNYPTIFRSTCIFNKDTRQTNFITASNNVKNLTTEEILQPELLESYGFPIMIEDDGV